MLSIYEALSQYIIIFWLLMQLYEFFIYMEELYFEEYSILCNIYEESEFL